MTKLEVRGLSKRFDTVGSNRYILQNINMTVNKGEFVCILGNTGCGKTTLLRILSGLEVATSGEIFLDGKLYKGPSRKMLMVFQDSNQLFPWKNLIDNVIYPLKTLKTKGKKDIRVIAEDLLDSVELGEFKKFYPYQLSGGMKQRGVLARALAMAPDIMLFDEPFSSLDEITRSRLQSLLLKIHNENQLLSIFVTHSIGEALFMADKIIVMGNAPNNILKKYDNPFRGSHKRDSRYSKLLEEIRMLMGKYPQNIF